MSQDPEINLKKNGRNGLLTFEQSFSELKIDKLKELAHEWVKDYREIEAPVNIEKVTLYKYRPDIYTRARIVKKCGSNGPWYAIVFELNCDGESPTVNILNNIDLISFTNGCNFVPYANFISRNTSHLSACHMFPGIFQTGFKEVYRDAKTKEEFEETLVYQWIFLPHCKGIDLSPSVRVDEESVVLFEGNASHSMDNYRKWIKKMMPDSNWEDSDIVIAERDENREQSVWDKNIKPLVDMYYNGVFQYKFFPEPIMINRGHLDLMLSKTMFLCYQGYDSIFPTDCFEKEVMKRLKAGQTQFKSFDLTDLFYTFIDSLFQKETLPIFLELLNLEYPEGIWPMTQIKISQTQPFPDAEHKTERLQPVLSPNEIFIQTLRDHYQEINLFWELLKRKAKDHSGSINAVEPGVFYDFALEVFENKVETFQHLEKKHLDNRDFYKYVVDRRRVVIGSILLKIIKDKCPIAITRSSHIDTSIEGLFNKFKTMAPQE